MINHDEIKFVLKLAKLSFPLKEEQSLVKYLNDFVDYISIIDEVDLSDFDRTLDMCDFKNVTRDDVLSDCNCSDDLLSCSDFPINKNQIKVNPIIIKN